MVEQSGLQLLSVEDMPVAGDAYVFMARLPVRLDWLLDNNIVLWGVDDQVRMVARDPADSRVVDLIAYLFPERAPAQYLGRAQDIDG